MSTNGTGSVDMALLLPSATPKRISKNITIQEPLSRLGRGPGLILLVDSNIELSGTSESLDPPPLQKWAEEGYVVAQVSFSREDWAMPDLAEAIGAIRKLDTYDGNPNLGLISES